MAYTRDPRIAKLPQWAQNEFQGLERRLAEQSLKLQALLDGPSDSNATLDPYSDYSTPLPRNPMIRHLLDGCTDYLETKFDGKILTVRGVSNSGFDDFLIVPALSNEIKIEFRRNKT